MFKAPRFRGPPPRGDESSIKNDEFCTTNDESCTKSDGLCTKIDEFVLKLTDFGAGKPLPRAKVGPRRRMKIAPGLGVFCSKQC